MQHAQLLFTALGSMALRGALPILVLGLTACGEELNIDPDTASAEAAVVADAAETAMVWAEASALTTPVNERDSGSDLLGSVDVSYARRSPCATRSRQNGTLRIDFGTGCTYRQWTISGALSFSGSRSPTGSELEVGFEQLASGQRAIDGTVRVGTSRTSTSVSLTGDLQTQNGTTMVDHLFAGTFSGTGTGVELTGTASRDDGTTMRDLDIAQVALDFGDCYPNSGTITVERSNQPRVIVGFSASTQITGEVSVQVGVLPPQTVILPPCAL